ncbi:transcription initiation factor TFIID TATA-box-binding protein [Paragonimus westermani]|uniref:Transcription initiation factor TFIID TATA-box-binding protein n=1 Tax=Paragonimus westermani TaxID=34504 RepID=A0A5J4NNR9_9TREM|nr:transcription initiation factor TFIID TATA-box-binding protein [Paragonimus westermani]
MSTNNAMIGFETTDSSDVANPTDLLDFLNSSDNELDDAKPTDPTEQSDAHSEADSANEESPSLTLSINNVVVMASMQCHLRLKELARSSVNVEYKPLQNHVIMRLRSPYTVATIWSSGKIWCTGANSLAKAKTGARRIARRIAKCGFPCRFSKFRVVNIMATCHLPFRVRLEELVKEKPLLMSYEPELSPGLTFKTDSNSSTLLKLFSTGRIVIMGPSMESISYLVEELVPLAALHQTDEPVSDTDEEDEKKHIKAEAAATRRMLFLPGELPIEALDYVNDEFEDSEEDSDTDDRVASNGYSTDDSTDSGASIDSGGVSTRPKRRFKPKRAPVERTFVNPLSLSSMDTITGAYSQPTFDPALPNGTVACQTSIACSQTFTTSVSDTDPTWSRKAVASGSTKRACVITYSGTEDSEDVANSDVITQVSIQPPSQSIRILSSTIPATVTLVTTPSITTTSLGSVIPSSVQSPGCLPQSVSPAVISYSHQQPQQYLIATAGNPFNQSVASTVTSVMPATPIHLSQSTIQGGSQPQLIRLTSNQVLSLPPQNGPAQQVYPVRIPVSGLQPTTVIPSVGTKFINFSSSAPTAVTAPFINATCVPAQPTYQFFQPSTGPGLYSPCTPQVQLTTTTFLPGSTGMLVGHPLPQAVFSSVQPHVVQPMPTVMQTFVTHPPHTKLI